jgi:hypothetical protein
MRYYLVFLDRLERLGAGTLGSNGSRDDQVPMDVDPPVKRQRVDGACPLTLNVNHGSYIPDRLSTYCADDLSTIILLDTSAGGGEHPTADID